MNIQCQVFKINVNDADKMMNAFLSDTSRNITFSDAITAQTQVVKSSINERKEMQINVKFFGFIASPEALLDGSMPHTFGDLCAKERRLSQDLARDKSQPFMASLSTSQLMVAHPISVNSLINKQPLKNCLACLFYFAKYLHLCFFNILLCIYICPLPCQGKAYSIYRTHEYPLIKH